MGSQYSPLERQLPGHCFVFAHAARFFHRRFSSPTSVQLGCRVGVVPFGAGFQFYRLPSAVGPAGLLGNHHQYGNARLCPHFWGLAPDGHKGGAGDRAVIPAVVFCGAHRIFAHGHFSGDDVSFLAREKGRRRGRTTDAGRGKRRQAIHPGIPGSAAQGTGDRP